jgi:hypothetical protein
MKKLFVCLTVLMFVIGTGAAYATCPGPECEPTVNADIQGEVGIHGQIIIVPNGLNIISGKYVQAPASGPGGGNFGTADVTLNADASATGMDTTEWIWVQDTEPSDKYAYYLKLKGSGAGNVYKKPFVQHPPSPSEWEYVGPYYGQHKEEVIVPGESESYGRNKLTLTSGVGIISNSPQISGLAYTLVHATTMLDITGEAWAEGTDGCPQEATIDVEGSISAYAYGNSFSGDWGGAYAYASGSGLTTVDFWGHESDFSTNGGWFSPNKAYVDFNSTITVDQEVSTFSYVSPDGTTSANAAYVGGGYAESQLGNDGSILGWVYDRDNIELTGIHASGEVYQEGLAFDGGAVATGNSYAYFSGANGTVEEIPGSWCTGISPGQTANVGGYAFAAGYNNVNVTGNMIEVTSVQYSIATTGNSGPVERIVE